MVYAGWMGVRFLSDISLNVSSGMDLSAVGGLPAGRRGITYGIPHSFL